MRLKELDIDLDNIDDDAICAIQTPGAATSLTLNGVIGTGSLTYGRALTLTSGGDDTDVTFTLTGTDADGKDQTEAIVGANAGAVVTTKYFKTVSTITVSGSTVATTIKVGTSGATRAAVSQTVPLNFYDQVATTVSVDVTGTIDFSIQETFDDIMTNGPTAAVWVAVSALAAKTADTTSPISRGATAVRVLVNSYTNGGELQAMIIPANNS